MIKILFMMILLPTVSFTLESQIDSLCQTYLFTTNINYQEQVTKKLLTLESTDKEEQLVIKAIQTHFSVNFNDGWDPMKISPQSIEKLKTVYTEFTNYCAQAGYNNLSSLFLTEFAKLRQRIMGYEKLPILIKLSMQAKKDYETAIKKDKNNFSAYLGFGQWYFYAPKIGGGSLKKAERTYKNAEKIITEPYQQYLLHIWRSQVYFKDKQEKKYQEELEQARNIFLNEGYNIEFYGGFYDYVVKRNKQGQTF